MNRNSILPPELIKVVNESLKNMRDSLKIIPQYLVKLANLGWFISLDITPRETGELCLKIKEKNFKAVDSFMIKYVSKKVNRVEKEVIEAFPKREKPLKEAFQAYKNKKYFLSIPVFIAQIDGIFIDIFDQYFFTSRETKKEELKKRYTNYNFGEILNAFFEPSGHKIEISLGKNEKIRNRVIYNRHEIMHGIDNEYGTWDNCLKIISLLDYIAEITRSKKY